MQIPIGNRIYDVIGEYKTYYLCNYNNLYRTCFLKTDVRTKNLNDDYRAGKSVSYYDRKSNYSIEGRRAPCRRVNGRYVKI